MDFINNLNISIMEHSRYVLLPCITAVGGYPGSECYLIQLEQGTALIDSGFGFCADKTVSNIKTALGRRTLDYILLTHSHYDHVLGSPSVKDRYPNAKVVASSYAATIMAKESARDVMRQLNSDAAENSGLPVDNSACDRLGADIIVSGKDTLSLGEETIEVIETPGHTNCSVSYYFRNERLLAASETLGVVLEYPDIAPGMIVSYRDTLASIDRMEALHPKHLLVPHFGLIPDKEIQDFFIRARASVKKTVAFIRDCRQQGKTEEQIFDNFKKQFYKELLAQCQPEAAFNMNTRAMIPRVLRELDDEVGEKNA